MPLFTLTRSFDPSWTDADFDRMMLRAVSGLAWSPPVYWHRSFGIDKSGPVEGFCVYEADSLRGIERQQRICWVPFTEARPVQEICGSATGPGRSQVPESFSLFLVERGTEAGASPDDIAKENAGIQSSEVTWLRSFWDRERHSSRCIFAAASGTALAAALAESSVVATDVQPVLEEHPSTWEQTYEQLGLPRPWRTPVIA